jgi:radical SAM superfamily enzyme YgiQ (UPF0313 family)
MAPPILEYLGALTKKAMPDVELQLIDANITSVHSEDINADLVGISCMTATANWAYKFADRIRNGGIQVVLGGIHPTAMPEETKMHADSVVVGEAESVWPDVLNAACNRSLKEFYHGKRVSLENIPVPLVGELKGPYKFRAVFTARGCPYKCSFCSVRKFFGDTIRYRPISKVVEEVEKCTGKIYFNGDDNIWGGNLKRSIELFTALSHGAKKYWYGFGDLSAVQGSEGDRLLKAAKESGLFSVWAGWETSSIECLRKYNALAKQGRCREEAVRKIKDYGIDVVLFVILGGRNDERADFDRTLGLAEKLGVGIRPVLLTPLPGTELYEEYSPYLIEERGWEFYTGINAVFEHPDPEMTIAVRERKFFETCLKLLTTSRIIKHLFEIPLAGFPMTHFLSLMNQIPMKRATKKAFEEWKRRDGVDAHPPTPER